MQVAKKHRNSRLVFMVISTPNLPCINPNPFKEALYTINNGIEVKFGEYGRDGITLKGNAAAHAKFWEAAVRETHKRAQMIYPFLPMLNTPDPLITNMAPRYKLSYIWVFLSRGLQGFSVRGKGLLVLTYSQLQGATCLTRYNRY